MTENIHHHAMRYRSDFLYNKSKQISLSLSVSSQVAAKCAVATLLQGRNRHIFLRGQSHFSWFFFLDVKCFFPVENSYFGRPKTNSRRFKKWKGTLFQYHYINIITYNINSKKKKQNILRRWQKAKRGLSGPSPKNLSYKLHTIINHEYKKQNKQAQSKVMPKTNKINHNY